MTRPLVADFLQLETLEKLDAKHRVEYSLSKCGRKASLNYHQNDSDKTDLLASQCRGLIVAREDWAVIDPQEPFGEVRVVAWPFDRFFNHGQAGCDASEVMGKPGTCAFEKLDGTLCILHYDNLQMQWHVATRSVPEGNFPIDGFGEYTFRTLFEKALRANYTSFEELTETTFKGATYMFELTTPYNRVVVNYPVPQVHLIGVRYNENGIESDPVMEVAGWTTRLKYLATKPLPLETFDEVLALALGREATESEGIVLRWEVRGGYQRAKIKNPAWVAASSLRGSAASSPRRLLGLVISGKHEAVLPLLPPDRQALGEEMAKQYLLTCERMDIDYDIILATATKRAPPDSGGNLRKELALAVQATESPMGYVMNRFTGKCSSFKEYVDSRMIMGDWPDGFLDDLAKKMGVTGYKGMLDKLTPKE